MLTGFVLHRSRRAAGRRHRRRHRQGGARGRADRAVPAQPGRRLLRRRADLVRRSRARVGRPAAAGSPGRATAARRCRCSTRRHRRLRRHRAGRLPARVEGRDRGVPAGPTVTAWRTLFTATELMPAHVAAQAAGVPQCRDGRAGRRPARLGRIADFWNTGLEPDTGRARHSRCSRRRGPTGSTPTPRTTVWCWSRTSEWWGNKPADRPDRGVAAQDTDYTAKVDDERRSACRHRRRTRCPDLILEDSSQARPGRGAEQLVLATGGVLAQAEARRAFALCVPRAGAVRPARPPGSKTPKLGLGSGPAQFPYRAAGLAVSIRPSPRAGPMLPRRRYARRGGGSAGPASVNPTVRIGYLGPDDRRAETVAADRRRLPPAGITVVDAGHRIRAVAAAPTGKVDAVLAGTASAPGPAGPRPASPRSTLCARAAASNFGAIRQRPLRCDHRSACGETNSPVHAESADRGREPAVERVADDSAVRHTAHHRLRRRLRNGIAGPTKAGTGWNMDRWVLKR